MPRLENEWDEVSCFQALHPIGLNGVWRDHKCYLTVNDIEYRMIDLAPVLQLTHSRYMETKDPFDFKWMFLDTFEYGDTIYSQLQVAHMLVAGIDKETIRKASADGIDGEIMMSTVGA